MVSSRKEQQIDTEREKKGEREGEGVSLICEASAWDLAINKCSFICSAIT